MTKQQISLVAVFLLVTGLAFAKSDASKTKDSGTVFVGDISDSMCGLRHPMADAKRCTLGCVKGFDGETFVLADHEHQKVYKLNNQKKAKEFAGEKVEVRGTLEGDTIHVISITPVH